MSIAVEQSAVLVSADDSAVVVVVVEFDVTAACKEAAVVTVIDGVDAKIAIIDADATDEEGFDADVVTAASLCSIFN